MENVEEQQTCAAAMRPQCHVDAAACQRRATPTARTAAAQTCAARTLTLGHPCVDSPCGPRMLMHVADAADSLTCAAAVRPLRQIGVAAQQPPAPSIPPPPLSPVTSCLGKCLATVAGRTPLVALSASPCHVGGKATHIAGPSASHLAVEAACTGASDDSYGTPAFRSPVGFTLPCS